MENKIFWAKKIHFHPFDPPYDLSPHLKIPKTVFFSRKNLFVILLVQVLLVYSTCEVKIFGFCYTEIGLLDQKWSKLGYCWPEMVCFCVSHASDPAWQLFTFFLNFSKWISSTNHCNAGLLPLLYPLLVRLFIFDFSRPMDHCNAFLLRY